MSTPLLDRINARKPQPKPEPASEWVRRAQERRLPTSDRTGAVVVA